MYQEPIGFESNKKDNVQQIQTPNENQLLEIEKYAANKNLKEQGIENANIKPLDEDQVSFGSNDQASSEGVQKRKTTSQELREQQLKNAKMQEALMWTVGAVLTTGAAVGGGIGINKLINYLKPASEVVKEASNIKHINDLKLQGENKTSIENLFNTVYNNKSQNVLLSGKGGTGKTYALEQTAKLLKSQNKVKQVYRLNSSVIDTPAKFDRELKKFENVSKNGKVIVLWDECDSNLKDNSPIVQTFKDRIKDNSSNNVMIWATTNHPEKIDEAVTTRFHSIDFKPPSAETLIENFNKFPRLTCLTDDEKKLIGKIMENSQFSYRNLNDLDTILAGKKNEITVKDIKQAVANIISGQNTSLEKRFGHSVINPEIIADDKKILGKTANDAYNALKDALDKQKIKPFEEGQGIIFEGQAGLGKTLVPNVVAKETNATMIDGKELKDIKTREELKQWEQWVLNKKNEAVLQNKPCFVFIDEADSALIDNSKAGDRYDVVNNCKETIERLQKQGVTFVASTNHVGDIDSAIKTRFSSNTFNFKLTRNDLDGFLQAKINDKTISQEERDVWQAIKNNATSLNPEILSFRSFDNFVNSLRKDDGTFESVDAETLKKNLLKQQAMLEAPPELDMTQKLIKQMNSTLDDIKGSLNEMAIAQSAFSSMFETINKTTQAIKNFENACNSLGDSNAITTLNKAIQPLNETLGKFNNSAKSFEDACAYIKQANDTLTTLQKELDNIKVDNEDSKQQVKNILKIFNNLKTQIDTTTTQLDEIINN